MLLTHRKALEAFALFTLFEIVLTSRLPAIASRHSLLDQLRKRQVLPVTTEPLSISTVSMSTPSMGASTTFTVITPSPSASPIAITSQSQVVTTFVPVMTLCPRSRQGGAQGALRSAPSYFNHTPAPYQNVTAARSPGCVTQYTASRTTVCDTTLKGIATQVHVTECDQVVVFSSLYGYSLSTIAPADTTETGPAPTMKTVTTYFQAPWQSLTDGMTPTSVTQRVCLPVPTNSEQCIDIEEVWETITVSTTKTSSTEIDITTTVPGPSVMSIETLEIDITGTITVISLSTILVHEYSTEHISTMRTTMGTITASSSSVADTSTNTVTVFQAPGESSSESDASENTTSTITLQVTSTIYKSGTTTMTTSTSVLSSGAAAAIFK